MEREMVGIFLKIDFQFFNYTQLSGGIIATYAFNIWMLIN